MNDSNEPGLDPYAEAARMTIALANELDLKGSDRDLVIEAVLAARLEAISAGDATRQPGSPAQPPSSNAPGEARSAPQPDVDSMLGAICARLGISHDSAELIYNIEDGEPKLVVTHKRIAGNKSHETKTIAKLVAAARQAAGMEEWTEAKVVRDVVVNYGALDPSNFAAHFGQLDDVAVMKGSGQTRAIKITRPGYEAIGEYIREITGDVG